MPLDPEKLPLSIRDNVLFGQVLHRCVEFTREAVDQASRTVKIAVSSEEPVERWFGEEILDHGEGSVVMRRLINRAPLLLGHDSDRQIGVVERAWLENRRLRAEVRFSKNSDAEAVYQDILDGIRGKISFGYQVKKSVLEKTDNGRRTYRATSWEPMEVSIVSVPADDTVGVGREADPNPAPTPMPDPIAPSSAAAPAPAPAPALSAAPPAPALATTDTRAHQPAAAPSGDAERIARFAQMFPANREAAMRAVAAGTSFPAFIDSLQDQRSLVPAPSPDLGLTQREAGRFSICRAIASIAFEGGLRGFEKEACDAFAKKHGLTCNERSFHIPTDITRRWTRDLTATVAASGGVTVATEVLGSDLIELLRARIISSRLGARTMFGLQGNISIPKVTGGATGQWLAEAAPITPSSQTFAQIALSPKRYGAATAYSRQFVIQTTIDGEAFVRDDLAQTVARALDLAVFEGSGAAGQPRGIIATTGVNTVTFGAAATWPKVVEFETVISQDNADYGNLAYVTTPAVRGKWKTTPKVTGAGNAGAGFLWQDQAYIPVLPGAGAVATVATPPEGIVNGYRAIASTIITGDKVIFGNFNDVIIASWLPLEIIVDPYSLSLNHQVRIVVNTLADIGVRHPESFAVSTDSGAQ
jgi:HK97 family phage prohead protease